MTAPDRPDRENVLMKLSALLDGELSADDEAQVFDAMSQDPALLAAFEAMSAARLGGAGLTDHEADDVTAAIMAATAPDEVPATLAGALELTNAFVDDCVDVHASDRLFALLTEKPALASPVAGFVASSEAVRQAARAVASIPSVVAALRHVPDHVDALVAARERAFVLASGAMDGALTDAEERELATSLQPHAADVLAFAQMRHAGEALRAASSSPAFALAGQKAGAAALHAIEAEAHQAALQTSAPVAPSIESREPLLARLWRAFAPARAPLAFGAAAAALFFVVSSPAEVAKPPADRMATRDAFVAAIAPTLLAQADRESGDLPVLADNTADVEALDATNSTVVFSTESSNITVIWVGTETGT